MSKRRLSQLPLFIHRTDTYSCFLDIALCVAQFAEMDGSANALGNLLRRQHETGHSVKKLVIRSCQNISRADVDPLDRAVDLLTWRGEERTGLVAEEEEF